MLTPVTLPVRAFPPDSPTKLKTLRTILQTNSPKLKSDSPSPLGKNTTATSFYLPHSQAVSHQNHFILRSGYGNPPSPQKHAMKHSFDYSLMEKTPTRSFHMRDSSFSGFVSTMKVPNSALMPSQDDLASPKMKLYKSDAGLNSPKTPALFQKRKTIEKSLTLIPTRSLANTSYTDKFMENFKKYKIVSPTRSPSKGFRKGLAEIDKLKSYVKIPSLKRPNQSPKRKEELREMEEINIVKKPGQVLSQEEEGLIKLLKKKVEISNMFRAEGISEEERRNLYKQLMLEYHPDKAKYDQRFAVEIFYFLQMNKSTFLIDDDC